MVCEIEYSNDLSHKSQQTQAASWLNTVIIPGSTMKYCNLLQSTGNEDFYFANLFKVKIEQKTTCDNMVELS